MIISDGSTTLIECPVTIQKPVSLYSDDPTDFSERKYMTIRTEYYLETNGKRRQITKEEAKEFVRNLKSGE